MATKKIMDFFNNKFFEIPKFQRGYAWDINNIRDLFDDITESQESNSSHFIGTIVLSRSIKDERTFHLVDGQQRIATITMIINAILKNLKKNDREYYRRFYIKEDEKYRLRLLGKDGDYFFNLLDGKKIIAQNKSQKLLSEAYEGINDYVADADKKLFLGLIERLEVMEFIEDSEGDAIRIFQTVNDRGKPLSNMEKAKSLLIYFSNRYLEKRLDDKINNIFGEIFDTYDDIKKIGEELSINPIKNVDFNEDNIMRYHFISYSDENYDATASYVLDYLKRSLRQLRNTKKNDFKQLEVFIDEYVNSLYNFFNSFNSIVKRCLNQIDYYKLFVILGVSATLYPLLVKMEDMDILDKYIPSKEHDKVKFLTLIELIDVRIYKTRGTDPRADISRFAYSLSKTKSESEIMEWLIWYNQNWMKKEQFQTYLNDDMEENRALPHIFIEYCEKLQKKKFDIKELKNIIKKHPQVEHILSQTPKFSPKSYGFKNEEDFIEHEHTLGNLTIIEKSLNAAARNKNPSEKITIYDKSGFKMTKIIAAEIHKITKFRKPDIQERTKKLAGFCVDRWWC